VEELPGVDLDRGALGAADVQGADPPLIVGGDRDALEHPLDFVRVEPLVGEALAGFRLPEGGFAFAFRFQDGGLLLTFGAQDRRGARAFRFQDLGAGFYDTRSSPERAKRNHIRQLEAPGYTVTLQPAA
jgi:hypothetical protein